MLAYDQMLKYLVICQKTPITSEAISEWTQKNSETMNFWSGSDSIGGFCGVDNWLPINNRVQDLSH